MHGALAEENGIGVILAAPGGTGKTTASDRLPAPWRSLCDDTTLVVRDSQGKYWGHPWPTWSRFLEGGPGGTWEVQEAVPLRGVFFLSQAPEDLTEPLGPGHAGLHFPTVPKGELLKRVVHGGPLPRKTFSMGEADEKRFYVEARRIR